MTKFIKEKINHYFFPHESNNYKAKTLHASSLLFYILLLIVFQFTSSFVVRLSPTVLGYATDITVGQLLAQLNQKRLEANLPPLSLSPELSTAATQKASDMFSNNYWAHVSPTGVTPWVFISSSGYNYLYAGENLAKDFTTSQEVIEAWMNSPTHRANILKPEYKDIGFSVMNGKLKGQETTLVVQEFGSRLIDSQPLEKNQPALSVSPTPTSLAVALQRENSKEIKNILVGEDRNTKSSSPIFLIPYNLTKTISLVLAEFLLIVLFIDSVYIWKYKTMRLSGHNIAHLIFIGALIGAMGATGFGVIL